MDNRGEQVRLASQELSMDMLLNAVVDYAIYMLDAEGCIASWNAGAERITGYRADQALGLHISEFFTQEDRAAGKPLSSLALANHTGRYEEEGWCVRRDGSRFWAVTVLNAIRNRKGRLVGFAKVIRDISQQRRDQAALEAAREELHQSQKMEALGHLTGGVAHDFNNFLTAIISSLKSVKASEKLDLTLLPQVDAALQAARNAASVVRQMLVFARKHAPQLVTIDVNKAVGDIVGLVRRSAHENVRLKLELSEQLSPARTDPVHLQTSILNLAVNAIDAMPQGGLLTIATRNCRIGRHERLAPGDYVCIAVSDTGGGMSDEILAHAFEPFFTTKELGKGTGLGLSMVYAAAQQLNGDVAIDSVPGEGTTVTLLLPAAQAESGRKAEPEAALPRAAEVPANQRLHVLYVEDDFLVALATLNILEKAGIDVRSASRADEALGVLDLHPEIDILLTDIGLPGMNGHELVAQARRKRPNLKVLFLTGYDRTGPIVGTEADALTRYMDKPYEPADLLATLYSLASAAPQSP